MGIFDIFKKKDAGATQQATLDSSLEKSREGIFSKISRAVAGKSKVDEEVLDQLALPATNTSAPPNSTPSCATK